MSNILIRHINFKQSGGLIFILLLLLSVIALPIVALKFGLSGVILILLGIIAPIVAVSIIKFPVFGVAVYLIMAYWIMFIMNIGIDFPLGTLMDGILVLLLIGFFIEQRKNPRWDIYKNPISIVILVWILYNVMQFINPNAASLLAWVYTIRAIAAVTISYYIFSYHINSVDFIRWIIKIWLLFSVIAALYAAKQEHLGFFEFEQKALDADERLQNLLFINGHWRKSSIFADPVSFSYNMIVSSIICVALMFGPTSRKVKVMLFFFLLLFLNVMLYSGTRAAYVLFPAAMFFLAILKINKKILFFSGACFIILIVLIRMPTSNNSINRFQSAFRPNNDASYNVRVMNQKRIQPYILSHPLGGGLGSTGASGAKFSPNTFLATFPPDSGYVRAAVELGWIGLLLLCALMFVALKTGIDNYFEMQDPELKTYCLAMLLMIFAMCIGNFPQEGFIQFPLNIYLYLAIALLNVTMRLDIQKRTTDLHEINK